MSSRTNNRSFEKFLAADQEVIEECNTKANRLITCLQILGELNSYDRTKIGEIQKTLVAQSRDYSEDLELQYAFETGLNHAIDLAELFCLIAEARRRRLLKRMKIALLRNVRRRMPGTSTTRFSQEVQGRLVFMLYVTFLFLQDAIDRYAALHHAEKKYKFHLLEGRERDRPDKYRPSEEQPAMVVGR